MTPHIMSAFPGESDDAFARRLQAVEGGATPAAAPVAPIASAPDPGATCGGSSTGLVTGGNLTYQPPPLGQLGATGPHFVYSNQPLPVFANVYQTGFYTTVPVGVLADPVRLGHSPSLSWKIFPEVGLPTTTARAPDRTSCAPSCESRAHTHARI